MQLADITKDAVLIREDATMREAVERMISDQTNSLLVVDDSGALTGEVSVSDILDAVVPEYLDGDSIAAHFASEEMFKEAVHEAENKPVSEFMSVDIDPVRGDDGLMAVAANAIAQRRARIPVVDHDNRPVGMISRRGLKQIMANYLNIEDSA